MSTMLDALKNLSARSHGPAERPAAPIAEEAPAAAPAADPVLPPAGHGRRMQDLLVKHLSAPAPIRDPAADAVFLSSEASGGMTLPMASLRPPLAMSFPSDDDGENVSESVEVVCLPNPRADMPVKGESVSIVSVGAVAKLLASLEEEPESPAEEIALSFGSPAEREQRAEVREEKVESEEQDAEISVSEPDANPEMALAPSPSPPLFPSPPLTPSPFAAAASPLDHLADARPLATYASDEEEPTPSPTPLVLPPRSISRGKTRLEQRVLDNLSHPSLALPYRELAERLQQDLRLLTGRCLLFTGIGPASHADDVLPHLASLLAEEDAEVLLVDADSTRAAMTVGLGALKETGLGELPDRGGCSQELVLPTLLPNVSLLPAGRKPLPDSIGVVDQVAQLLAQLEERYSLVLIDGGAHTGALVPALARLCDATYFVVRLGATDVRAATTALQTFRANGARILGCVATCGATSK
jgi:hypothetical protein